MDYGDETWFLGKVLKCIIGKEGNQFDLSNNGAVLLMYLPNPTENEIFQVKNGILEMKLTCLPDTLWLTFRFGTLEWEEAPFTPHLAKQVRLPENLFDACSNLKYALIDSMSGTVVGFGCMEFSKEFSAALRTGIMLLLSYRFNETDYRQQLTNIQERYSVEELSQSAVVSAMMTSDIRE